MSKVHSDHINFIWTIANLLRCPYRPPQYRKVMLPLTVLRRLDCVLKPTKEKVIEKCKLLKKKKIKNIDPIIKKVAAQEFYNTSPLTFEKMVGAHENIAQDLKNYIKSFSENARNIIERFGFEEHIDKLDETNRLYKIMLEFSNVDLSPERVTNIDMGYIFEELVRKFNEQANEEAGDHFTPREVIRLMTHILYAPDDEVFNNPGLVVKVYDPACGTGGMLSVSDDYIREHSEGINLELFGQEYNDESWAICCSDMLIKGENPERIIFGDSFGDGKTEDGHPNEKFHYMLANPPFGVEWKPEEEEIRKEYDNLGFTGRFGAGLPRINDGSLLFLQHMISKMETPPEEGGRGARIAIVFNGSPLFTGDTGSGESNIRRWIIENDWLEAIIALPDQMFYNTGIFTYIWIVTNRKVPERKGKVQLINAVSFYQKKKPKSLGEKRNEMNDNHINEITRIYGKFKQNEFSKILNNIDFAYIKIMVERPLRLNFQAIVERIENLWEQTAFKYLAESKKRKDKKKIKDEIRKGKDLQQAIIESLETLDQSKLYKNRDKFIEDLSKVFKKKNLKVPANIIKTIINSLGERDPDADICYDKKGNPEPDSELRDAENVPLPKDVALPLPLEISNNDKKIDKSEIIDLFKDHCEEYMQKEVLPYVSDAWVDYSKVRIGYEMHFNRYFYKYISLRTVKDIDKGILNLEKKIIDKLSELRVNKEKYNNIIKQSVKKGINSDVKMKDSGYKWLGNIPKHWITRKLKYVASVKFSNVDKKTVENEESVRLCNYVDVYYNDQINNDLDFMKATASVEEIEKFQLKSDDVLITKDSESWDDIAVPAYVNFNEDDLICGYHLAQIRSNKNILDGKFLYWLFYSDRINYQYRVEAKGVTRYGLSNYVLINSILPIPPLEEQIKINDYLSLETQKLKSLIRNIEQSIKLLDEYKASLISSIITGKTDVRNSKEEPACL